jgi:hypothetical protein
LLIKSHRQERLSRAYIQAIAAYCGLSYLSRETDYGLDLSLYEVAIQDGYYAETGYQLDVQVRSTTAASLDNEHVRYDLKVKTYNDLRPVQILVPRLLVVYVLPEDEAEWLSWSEEHLILRRTAYWLSLAGKPEVKNKRTVRLAIPRANVFSVEGLRSLMKRVREGGIL